MSFWANGMSHQEAHEEALVDRLKDKLTRAKNPMKRHRYMQRLQKAEVRLLAIKLAKDP